MYEQKYKQKNEVEVEIIMRWLKIIYVEGNGRMRLKNEKYNLYMSILAQLQTIP